MKTLLITLGIYIPSVVQLLVAQPVLTNLVTDGDALILEWLGGTSPYLLQRKTGLTDTNWENLTATTPLHAVVPRDSDTAFYRLMDHTTRTNFANPLLAFSARLTGVAVRPVP